MTLRLQENLALIQSLESKLEIETDRFNAAKTDVDILRGDFALSSAAMTNLFSRTGDMYALHVTLCAVLKLQLSPSVCKAAVQEVPAHFDECQIRCNN